jgi:hypothetical protein
MWAANAGRANWSTRSLREVGAFKRVKGRIDGVGQAVTGGAGHLFSSPLCARVAAWALNSFLTSKSHGWRGRFSLVAPGSERGVLDVSKTIHGRQ